MNELRWPANSLLRESDGAWNLSPAYDLVPVKLLLPDDPDELALNLNGKKRRLTAEDFAAFAQTLHLTQVQYSRALARLTRTLAATLDTALNRSFLSERFQSSSRSLLTERMKTIATSANS